MSTVAGFTKPSNTCTSTSASDNPPDGAARTLSALLKDANHTPQTGGDRPPRTPTTQSWCMQAGDYVRRNGLEQREAGTLVHGLDVHVGYQ